MVIAMFIVKAESLEKQYCTLDFTYNVSKNQSKCLSTPHDDMAL
jgi:hypothetical protein